jgi:hypothetical protein
VGKNPTDPLIFRNKARHHQAMRNEYIRRGEPGKGKTKEEVCALIREQLLAAATTPTATPQTSSSSVAPAIEGTDGCGIGGLPPKQWIYCKDKPSLPLPHSLSMWQVRMSESGRMYVTNLSESKWVSDIFPHIRVQEKACVALA